MTQGSVVSGLLQNAAREGVPGRKDCHLSICGLKPCTHRSFTSKSDGLRAQQERRREIARAGSSSPDFQGAWLLYVESPLQSGNLLTLGLGPATFCPVSEVHSTSLLPNFQTTTD